MEAFLPLARRPRAGDAILVGRVNFSAFRRFDALFKGSQNDSEVKQLTYRHLGDLLLKYLLYSASHLGYRRIGAVEKETILENELEIKSELLDVDISRLLRVAN
jgi:hypothetical protein